MILCLCRLLRRELHALGCFKSDEEEPCADSRPRRLGERKTGVAHGRVVVHDAVVVVELIEAGAYLDDRTGDEIGLVLLRRLGDDVGQGVDGLEKVSALFVARHRIVEIAAVIVACLAHD